MIIQLNIFHYFMLTMNNKGTFSHEKYIENQKIKIYIVLDL